jgi:glycosyltransferase involved in cell wall biosynthesis
MLFLTPGLSSLKRKRPDLFLASFYFYPNSLWRLRKIVRSFRPDVVNVHFPDHQIPFVLALRGLINVRLVVSLHGHDIERLNIDDLVPNENGISGLRYQRPAVDRLRSILVRADAVTACSQYLLEKAIRFEPSIGSKGRVIHNGIDLTRFRNKTAYVSSRSYILGLGRLVRAKGFDLLLDAFAQTGSEKTDLIIAGAGEERAALENQARELGLEGRVHFFGPATAEQAVSLLNGCMLVVIPSRSESFGIVALDALAAGKPILATSVGGLVELLTDVY